MNDVPLIDLFVRARSISTTFEGVPIFSAFPIEGIPRTRGHLRWRSRPGAVVQGVQLDATDGRVEVAGARFTRGVLWQDTAPDVCEIGFFPKRGTEAMSLTIRNCWRTADGDMQSSLGNAAMRVSWSGSVLVLSCSDGVGGVDFSDQVVEIGFDQPPDALRAE